MPRVFLLWAQLTGGLDLAAQNTAYWTEDDLDPAAAQLPGVYEPTHPLTR